MLYLAHSLQAGVPLPAKTVAELVDDHAYALVQESLLNPRSAGKAPDERLQDHLRAIVGVLRVASAAFRTTPEVVRWYRSTQLSGFGGRTPREVILSGRAGELLKWLEGERLDEVGDL